MKFICLKKIYLKYLVVFKHSLRRMVATHFNRDHQSREKSQIKRPRGIRMHLGTWGIINFLDNIIFQNR